MPLPFILVGAAIAAAGFGTKKGYDGFQDKIEANDILERAKRQYEESAAELESADKITHNKLDQLGNLQLDIGKDFKEFQTIAEELLDKLNDASKVDIEVNVPKYQRKRIERLSMGSVAYASKLAGGAVGGTAAAYAVYGGVMALAAASTGTPIAALSGVAAYNATLAAIGGGSLAAGGLGMAGGTAILGGVVAAPVLAVAGWAFASHAEEALSKAIKTTEEVAQFVKDSKSSCDYLQHTRDYVNNIIDSLESIRTVFNMYLGDLKAVEMAMLEGNTDILDKENDIVRMVENGYAIAAILTNIIITPLFRVKEKEGVPLVDQNGIPEFETNSNGTKVLNKTRVRKIIAKSNRDIENFKR
ncbi:MAG: chemotaxis protein [Psychrobacter sp.]